METNYKLKKHCYCKKTLAKWMHPKECGRKYIYIYIYIYIDG